MPDEPPATVTPTLSPSQRTRVDCARTDLERILAIDLAGMEAWRMILLVERLRHRLDDVLAVLAEAAESPGARAHEE